MTDRPLPPPPGLGWLPPAEDGARDSLFLDFDGTLVPLAATPDGVVVPPMLGTLLRALNRRWPGRVAVVSGRPVAALDRLLGPVAAELAVAGSHGAEIRVPGTAWQAPVAAPGVAAAQAELAAWATAHGLVFEHKPLGAALHYRQVPAMAAEAEAAAAAVAARHGLVLQLGKMMAEVRMPGNKGQAVAALLATPAMNGSRPWFVGDDVTDEDGFAAAAAAGGAGVLVGEPRETGAAYRVADPAAVLAWLGAIAGPEEEEVAA